MISCFTSARASISARILEKFAQMFILPFCVTFVQFSSRTRVRLAKILDVKHEINFKRPNGREILTKKNHNLLISVGGLI